ncbi:MAG: hypothetical protein ACRDPF_06740 [Streptosporangiaceae bacterium]
MKQPPEPPSRHALAYAAGLARRGDRWLLIVRIWRLGGLVPAPLTRAAQAERVRQLAAAPARLVRHACCPVVVVP